MPPSTPALTLESLPVELLLRIISEVVISSTRPDHKPQQFLPGPGTTRTGWGDRIPTGIHAVSLTSRHLHGLANVVLYRTVVLDREKDILLFGRTVNVARDASRSGRTGNVTVTLAFLQDAVKRLAITYTPMCTGPECMLTLRIPNMKVSHISTILTACSGARTIAIPSQWAIVLRDIRKTAESLENGNAPTVPTLTELLLSSYVDLVTTVYTIPPIAQWRPSAPSTPVHSLPATPSGTRPSTPDHMQRRDSASARNSPSRASIFEYITHLRIAEPAYAWYSPLALLKVFPSLTHIALPRRAHANIENDEAFMEDVKAILREPRMQVIVIAIFPQIQVGADKEQGVDHDVSVSLDIKNSTIWLAVEELAKSDGRLFVVNARVGSWRKDWQGSGVVASPEGPANWWRKVLNG